MKILSNFDTWHAKKLHAEYAAVFGEEYVLLIRKSRLIWYATIFLPISSFVVVASVGAYAIYTYGLPSELLYRAFRWIVVLRWVILCSQLMAKYVDYSMDFLLVTPKEIMKYDQHGVFWRTAEKIAADKIRTITVRKSWFFASIFDVWSVVFLAEGDTPEGDIVMDYVDHVDRTEKQMRHVLGQDRK